MEGSQRCGCSSHCIPTSTISVKPNLQEAFIFPSSVPEKSYFCLKKKEPFSLSLYPPQAGLAHYCPALALGKVAPAKGTLEPGHVTPGQASHQGVTSPSPLSPGCDQYPAPQCPRKPSSRELSSKMIAWAVSLLGNPNSTNTLNTPLTRKAKKWWYSHTGIACSHKKKCFQTYKSTDLL